MLHSFNRYLPYPMHHCCDSLVLRADMTKGGDGYENASNVLRAAHREKGGRPPGTFFDDCLSCSSR